MNTTMTEARQQADARLLVVEDEPNILELLSASLESHPGKWTTMAAEVEAANNRQLVIRKAQRSQAMRWPSA